MQLTRGIPSARLVGIDIDLHRVASNDIQFVNGFDVDHRKKVLDVRHVSDGNPFLWGDG